MTGCRALTCFVITAAIVSAMPRASTAAEPASRRNVVLILADDLGFMDVGCNNPRTFYETPNIDRLAAQGMRFTAGYAACPVCSPTRASILTGKVPPRTGITDFIGGTRAGKLRPAPYRHDAGAGGGHPGRVAPGRGLRHVLRRQVAPRRRGLLAERPGVRPGAHGRRAVLLSGRRRPAGAGVARGPQDDGRHRRRGRPVHRGATGTGPSSPIYRSSRSTSRWGPGPT